MARGTTLGQMVVMLREECGHATSAALGQNYEPHLKHLLRRTQEVLWNDHDWPHLRIQRDEPLLAGERYYSFPPDLAFERVESLNAFVKYAGDWHPIVYGIGPAQYNTNDSEEGEQESEVRRWAHYEGGQYEVWPVPPANDEQTLRFYGLKKLSNLLANEDRADLDDHLIVLFAAAEILKRQKSPDAPEKLAIAQQLFRRLKGQQSKTTMVIMGGGRDPRMGEMRPHGPLYGKRI
jgi:hypothetical protein